MKEIKDYTMMCKICQRGKIIQGQCNCCGFKPLKEKINAKNSDNNPATIRNRV